MSASSFNAANDDEDPEKRHYSSITHAEERHQGSTTCVEKHKSTSPQIASRISSESNLILDADLKMVKKGQHDVPGE